MIIDKLQQASLYYNLGERMTKGLQYLRTNDFMKIADGQYEIEGLNIFAIVTSYTTRTIAEARLEAHKRYIDIHLIVSGKETMYFAPAESLKVIENYTPEKDIMHLSGDSIPLTLPAGYFAVFFPTDAHMPAIQVNGPAAVKKVVIKIKAD